VPRFFLKGCMSVMAAALAAVFAAAPAAAQDLAARQFDGGSAASSAADPADREFIREWEANPPKGYATLSAANIAATKQAIKKYQDIVARGGWRTLPSGDLRSGMGGAAVALLRERLRLSGDLGESSGYDGDSYGYDVEKAVRRYQASNGLPPTGAADKRTIAALNVPAAARLRQLQVNLARLTELTASAARKYVLVNIPAAQVEAIENGRVALRQAGVVGKPERATPLLRSTIQEMNFNPVWRLPPTVISKDLIPKGREMQRAGKNVLLKFGIDAYDGGGRKLDPEKINWNSSQPSTLVYSQKPGKENPLGFLKLNFPNEHSVYMHDTPSEGIFGRNFRAASSGCIRVQGIEKLAQWLLAGQGWDDYHIQQIKESGERKDVRVKRPVPLYFVYVTAWATEDGVVQFRRDLYNKDGVGAVAAAY